MYLQITVIISVIFIVSGAAVINPDINLSATVSKDLPEPTDNEEHWDKNKHIEKNITKETEKPNLKKSTQTEVNTTEGIKSNSATHHNDNKLGHEKITDTNISNRIHSKGTQKIKANTPTGSSHSQIDMEKDIKTDINGTTTDQSLNNGNVHTEEENKTKQFNKHSLGITKSHDQPEKDHTKETRISFDNNQTSDISHQTDLTKQTINQPNSIIEITGSNDVINKSEYNTHNTQVKVAEDTPDKHKELRKRTDSVDTEDNTVTREKTNVVWETPLVTLQIEDENKEEDNNENNKHQEHLITYVSDKYGNGKLIEEKSLKELTDETLEHTNTMTIKKIPKLSTSTPLVMTLTTSGLDEQHLQSNAKNEKQILTVSPTTTIIEKYNEEETEKYDFNPLSNEDDDDNDEDVVNDEKDKDINDKQKCNPSNDVHEKPSEIKNDTQAQEENKHKKTSSDDDNKAEQAVYNNNVKNDNYHAVLLLIPDNKIASSDYINSAMQSKIITKLSEFIKSNNLSSNIMLAGPINNEDSEDLISLFEESVKEYDASIEIAKINISANIIQVHSREPQTETKDESSNAEPSKIKSNTKSSDEAKPKADQSDKDTSKMKANSNDTDKPETKLDSQENKPLNKLTGDPKK